MIRCTIAILITCITKGELEHRSSKSRYSRTNKKDFLKQMTTLEQRQNRLGRIRQSFLSGLDGTERENLKADFENAQMIGARYSIGKTYSSSEHIPQFLQRHADDPAVKVGVTFIARPGIPYSIGMVELPG